MSVRDFPLGQVVITATAKDALHPEDISVCLARHRNGNWGELDDEDRQANNVALDQQLRLFSVYRDRIGTKFWIITEADRSATTILLPEDY